MVTISQKRIRRLRDSLGMTQEQLAKRLGVNRSAVAQWEIGRTKPSGSAQILLRQIQDEANQKKISKAVDKNGSVR